MNFLQLCCWAYQFLEYAWEFSVESQGVVVICSWRIWTGKVKLNGIMEKILG